jgi:Na+:H+ antiporter, NhaA family
MMIVCRSAAIRRVRQCIGGKMASDHGSAGIDVKASLVLLAATALALVLANTPLAGTYKAVLDAPLSIGAGTFALTDTLKGWIKNALMAVFFVYVGLEIKHEFTDGALADRQRAMLPFAAAAGGIIVPSLIYLALAGRGPGYLAGWAIPSATDIAFAVGVVGLLGPSVVPPALKAFLLAVAVIDDLAAILIIAIGYSSGFSFAALALAAATIAALYALNRMRHAHLASYICLGLALWLFVLKSGINPTLAGVVMALFIPRNANGAHLLDRLMKWLKLPVLFAIMPIFALANAGVSLKGLSVADFVHPVTSGIALGLLIGKPFGITIASYLAVQSGQARLPTGCTWPQMIAIACLAGIGFTMSLFIGALAFKDGPIMEQVRLGVLLGSTASALIGIVMLRFFARRAG